MRLKKQITAAQVQIKERICCHAGQNVSAGKLCEPSDRDETMKIAADLVLKHLLNKLNAAHRALKVVILIK